MPCVCLLLLLLMLLLLLLLAFAFAAFAFAAQQFAKEFFHLGVLGMPGVCSKGMLGLLLEC